MNEKKYCDHKRFVKWFAQSELPVYRKQENGTNKKIGHLTEVVFFGCLDCGKVIVEDYAE